MKTPRRRPAPRSKPTHRRPAARGKNARPKRPAAKAPVAPVPRTEESEKARQLAHQIAALVADKKAQDVVILDVRGKTSYADYVVIASGDSERQVSAMAENVMEKLRESNRRPLGSEGLETGHWVLLDYGEVVAHFFFTEVRAFYDLEGLWADAPRERVA